LQGEGGAFLQITNHHHHHHPVTDRLVVVELELRSI